MKFANIAIALSFISSIYALLSKPSHSVPYAVRASKKCYHKQSSYPQYLSSTKLSRKSKSHYLNAQFDNIRIHFDYTYTLPYEEKIIKEFIIPPVKSFYESTLKVRRVPGTINFPQKGEVQCQGIDIPPHMLSEGVEADIIIFITTVRGIKKYEYDKKNKNTTANRTSDEVEFLDKYFRNIINKTDNHTLFEWEVNDGPEGVVGWSYSCIQDMFTYRPIVGVMQYVSDIIPDEREIQEAIWTTLHEFNHIFVFDTLLYENYIDSNFQRIGINKVIRMKSRLKGLKRIIEHRKEYMNDLERFLFMDNVTEHKDIDLDEMTMTLPLQDEYEEIPLPSNFNLSTVLYAINNFSDYTKIYISTPKVLKKAKKYFGCNSMIGVELEHIGGLGSAYSHWSKRILNTDYMIADSYGENYISSLSLALFEDSGWYKVDYSKAQDIKWGKGKGCSFLNEKCIEEKRSNKFLKKNLVYSTKYKNEFCTNFNEEQCSINRKFRGVCAVREFESKGIIPKEYNYFSKNKDYKNDIGGVDTFGDYCPYPLEIRDKDLYTPIGNCITGKLLRKDNGEKICEDCRCFHSSLTHHSKEGDLKAICYETKCKRDSNGKDVLAVYVEDKEILCPYKGGMLTVDGYQGEIECPEYSMICNEEDDIISENEWMFSHISKKLLRFIYSYVIKIIK